MILYTCSPINSSSLFLLFHSSVYLIVPNIFRCIVYLFCFFQVLIHEIQLVRTKTSSSSSSSVFFLFTVKAFWSVYVRMCTTMPSSSSSLPCKPEVSLTRSIKSYFCFHTLARFFSSSHSPLFASVSHQLIEKYKHTNIYVHISTHLMSICNLDQHTQHLLFSSSPIV